MKKLLFNMVRELLIREYKSSGLSQKDFTKRVGIARNTLISVMLNELHSLKCNTVDAIIDYFGYTYGDLEKEFGNSDDDSEIYYIDEMVQKEKILTDLYGFYNP